MKALVYTAPHQLAFRDEPEPQPGGDTVLIRVEAVGICGSDMHAYHGHDSRRPAPLILGHEAAGEVLTGRLAGRKVAVNPLVTDPNDQWASRGRANLSPTRQIISMPPRPGAFAEYTLVPERNLSPLPQGFDIERAALAEPLAVSWHAVRRALDLASVSPAECRLSVLGGGAIGLGAALAASAFGVGVIAICETNPARRAMLERAGNFRVYAPGDAGEPAESSVDIVVDAVGAGATRAAACRIAAPGGVIVHVGLLPGQDGLDIRKITLQEITVTGAYCYTPEGFRETLAALVGGQLGALDWYKTQPLAEGAAAFADIDAGKVAAAKVILRP
jgi:threonine dehydrogenase-like Zn-dependent dehydrogenase